MKMKQKKEKKHYFSLITTIVVSISVLTSCSSVSPLKTEGVCYQSVRKAYKYDNYQNPTIQIDTYLSDTGDLTIVVTNHSSDIMTIDMEKSFVVSTTSKSYSFYDPTVRVETISTLQTSSSGRTVNLGAIAGAVGVGGKVGQILGGINVSGGNTSGTQNTTATYFSELPQVSLPPKGSGVMPKTFNIGKIGKRNYHSNNSYTCNSFEEATIRFSICISYSIDRGESWQKFEQWYYFSADIYAPVKMNGHVNDALRSILQSKTDAVNEPWWQVFTITNYKDDYEGVWGVFSDFQ